MGGAATYDLLDGRQAVGDPKALTDSRVGLIGTHMKRVSMIVANQRADVGVVLRKHGRKLRFIVDVGVDESAADANDAVGREEGIERIDLRLPSNFVAGGRRVD